MNIFKKLFGLDEKKTEDNIDNTAKDGNEEVFLKKADRLICIGDKQVFKLHRDLSEKLTSEIQNSTIPVVSSNLFMHYWTENLECTDSNDPEWQNQALFFWKAEESFPKKSLPNYFEDFEKKNFVFVGDISKIEICAQEVQPWFGMPGLGRKFWCEFNGKGIAISELINLGIIRYIDNVELNEENIDILNDNDDYFFLIDERMVQLKDNNIFIGDEIVPADIAYAIGGMHIVKYV